MVSETEIFKNAEAARTLIKDGVVKIPFLNDRELNAVNNLYDSMHNGKMPLNTMHGIHMTIWHPEERYKTLIRDGIKEIFESAFERNFVHYRALTQQFIIKDSGGETAFHIHQDWAIVDETKNFSLNIWIPLHDVDEHNGAMWIVKGSHRLDRPIRGAGILFPNYSAYFNMLKPYTTSFKMKAGEALVFYHCTLHGSPSNQSRSMRKAVQVSLVHEETPLHIYFQKNAQSPLEIHHPDDNFTYRYQNIHEESSQKPPTENADELIFPFRNKDINGDEILNIIRTQN